MPPHSLTSREVIIAARAAVAALSQNNLSSCLFGSAACYMYGMRNRIPNDVDVVVLTDNMTQEEIKEFIVRTDSNFYLLRSKSPNATYRVLWYTLPRGIFGFRRICKVDILIPGLIGIPDIPTQKIQYAASYPDIPLMPLWPLVVLKLKGWADHLVHEKQHMKNKVPQDVRDVNEMLTLVAADELASHMLSDEWPEWFMEEAATRVVEYMQKMPNSVDSWRRMGFTT